MAGWETIEVRVHLALPDRHSHNIGRRYTCRLYREKLLPRITPRRRRKKEKEEEEKKATSFPHISKGHFMQLACLESLGSKANSRATRGHGSGFEI